MRPNCPLTQHRAHTHTHTHSPMVRIRKNGCLFISQPARRLFHWDNDLIAGKSLTMTMTTWFNFTSDAISFSIEASHLSLRPSVPMGGRRCHSFVRCAPSDGDARWPDDDGDVWYLLHAVFIVVHFVCTQHTQSSARTRNRGGRAVRWYENMAGTWITTFTINVYYTTIARCTPLEPKI